MFFYFPSNKILTSCIVICVCLTGIFDLSLCACQPWPCRFSLYRHHLNLFLQIPLIFPSLSVHVAVGHMQKKNVIQRREGCSTKSSPWSGKTQPAVSTLERWSGCCTSVSEIRAEQIRGPGRIGTKRRKVTLKLYPWSACQQGQHWITLSCNLTSGCLSPPPVSVLSFFPFPYPYFLHSFVLLILASEEQRSIHM